MNDHGCLIWTGTRNPLGYGVFIASKHRTSAHRWSWSHQNGPIPLGGQILHKCNNPSCVNPEHLKLGDHLDNMKDRKDCGNYAYRGRLSREDIITIYNSPKSDPVIAKQFSLSRSLVYNIRKGYLHSSITGGNPSPFQHKLHSPNNFSARIYKVVDPFGGSEVVTNLTQWCREHIHLFRIPPTRTSALEKLRSGLASKSGYQLWRAFPIPKS